MADTDTVEVLAPETVIDDAQEPYEETEAQVETETEDGEDDPETETFTKEDLERTAKETEERIRSEERERAEAAAIEQQRAQSREFLTRTGIQNERNLVEWAGKQVGKAVKAAYDRGDNVDVDAIAALVGSQMQEIAVRNHVAAMQAHVLQDTFDSLAGHFDAFLKKEYPDWRPDNDMQSKFAREVASKDANRTYLALYEKMRAAVLESEVPKKLEVERKASEEKNKKGEAVKNLQNPPKSGGPAKVNGAGNPPKLTVDTAGSIADKRRAFEEQYGIPFPG